MNFWKNPKFPILIIGAWLFFTQAGILAVSIGKANYNIPAGIAFAGSILIIFGGLAKNSTLQRYLLIGAFFALAVLFLAFPQGEEQFAISTVLRKYGYEIGSPQDKQRWMDDVENGKVSLLTIRSEIEEVKKQASPLDVFFFKAERYARLLMWPHLDSIAERTPGKTAM